MLRLRNMGKMGGEGGEEINAGAIVNI